QARAVGGGDAEDHHAGQEGERDHAARAHQVPDRLRVDEADRDHREPPDVATGVSLEVVGADAEPSVDPEPDDVVVDEDELPEEPEPDDAVVAAAVAFFVLWAAVAVTGVTAFAAVAVEDLCATPAAIAAATSAVVPVAPAATMPVMRLIRRRPASRSGSGCWSVIVVSWSRFHLS